MAPDPLIADVEYTLDRWRVRAHFFRDRLQQPDVADMADAFRGEMAHVIRRALARPLTVAMAAALVGRCASTIRKYIASGRLPNVGRPYKPLVLLEDLRKHFPSPHARECVTPGGADECEAL